MNLHQEAPRRRRRRVAWGWVVFWAGCLLVGFAVGWALGARL